MLGGVKLRLGYSHERNCFAYINSKYCTNNEQAQSIQMLWKGRQIMLWTVFSSGVPEGIIAVNPTHSRLLDLEEGVEIFVSPYSDIKVLEQLFVVPDSPDDQEIVEQNAELLQLNLLDQLRLVVKDQRAVVWISVSLPIVFTPKQTGLLVNHSSVIVKMDAFLHLPHTPLHSPTKTEHKNEKQMFNNVEIILDGLLKQYYNAPQTKVLRALPIESDGSKNTAHPFRVFIHEDFIPNEHCDGKTILATVDPIPSVIDVKSNSEDDAASNQPTEAVCVEVIPINNIVFKSLSREDYDRFIPTAIIPFSLNNILCLENGQKVIFTFLLCDTEQLEHIQIMSYSDNGTTENDVVNKFKQLVLESINAGNTVILNDGLTVQQKQISNGVLTFKLRPDKLKFTVLKSDSLRNCPVSAKCLDKLDRPTMKKNKNVMDYELKNYCRSVDCVEEMVKRAILHLKFEICREARFKGASEIKGNILVTGSSGSGKSSFCEHVAKDATYWSYTLQCRSLRGRKDIPELLGKAILTCQERSPAVLFCDDIDSLVPPETEGGAPQDIAYYNRLAVVIKQMLRTCTGVCVLMTAVSVKSLHPVLREFRGKPMFTAHFEIPELQQFERLQFLKHLINENVRNDFYVDDEGIIKMAMDTSGQHFRDLLDYVNRKIYKAVKKKYASLSEELPSLMEEVNVCTDSGSNFDIWGSLGGLHDVKQQLTESIFWPMMYPALFPSQSCGILLFGPPGTGKSFIGSCLSRLANMNFLSVKGPELLSKYIGQSEKAVRDIFDKADMKRPCILFFDEFDSLAPKRGHDSTGVTDRVVNQLLVRLDGAEGGARGPVIVATSRPDLIDPALLRPGRLDRHIYCPLPDQKDRVEVLRTLGSSVNVCPEVDLEQLAIDTEGFSPADLKALLVTAQLTALEKQLENGEGSKPECVVVEEEDVRSALLETRPSLSPRQRLFYHTINKRFRGERLTDEEVAQLQGSQKQKVTLA